MEQVFTMIDGFTMAAPFSRCPTCYTNLIHSICEITCSPRQYEFISAAEVVPEGNLVDWRKYT